MHKIDTAETKAHKVFVSWASRPNNEKEAAYLHPMKIYYDQYAEDKGLIDEWGLTMIPYRRDFNRLEANEKLPAAKESQWHWDALVTVGTDTDTAETVGRRLASAFTHFNVKRKEKAKFVFRHAVSNNAEELLPLTYYLLDEDAVAVFRRVFEDDNAKEDMMKCDDVLESYFGTAEKGRALLESVDWAQ
jgi:hypothetical protein